MSDLWSNNPNAPQIPLRLYTAEKTIVAGDFISSILHGIVIVLFFRCMNALLSPKNRMRESNKWEWGFLPAHTVALFLVTSTSVALSLYGLEESYINGREYPGGDGIPPGPYGYQYLPQFLVVRFMSDSAVQMNQWLVDGLLLYRCYIIYGMNYWAIAIPFVMYLASWATGIALIYADLLPFSDLLPALRWGDGYYSIALSLNLLLTLMIITRLVLHNKNIRSALGAQDGISGLYKTIIAMLVESCALYAVSFLLLVGPWASQSIVQLITFQALPEVQCIAPFLITLRVANRTALTSEAVASGNLSTICFTSQGESTGGDGTLSSGNLTHSTSDADGEAPGEHDAGDEKAVEVVAR